MQTGVRQGSPLSPVLFDLVIQQVLKEVRAIWQKRWYATNVGAIRKDDRLTHVAFADDMTLLSRSCISMKRMLSMLSNVFLEVGNDFAPCEMQGPDESS